MKINKLHFAILVSIAAAMICVSCTDDCHKGGKAVLTGEVRGDFDELLLVTMPLDDYGEYIALDSENGSFRYDFETVEKYLDMVIGVDRQPYGLRLKEGDSVNVILTVRDDGMCDVEYFGTTERESRILTEYYEIYEDISQYISQARPLELLYSRDSAFRGQYGSLIGDDILRRTHQKRIFIERVVAQYAYADSDESFYGSSYCDSLFSQVDPEDPIALACGNVPSWAWSKAYPLADNDFARISAFLGSDEARIRSQKAREKIAESFVGSLNVDPDLSREDEYYELLDRIAVYSPGSEKYINETRKSIENYKKMLSLTDIPDVKLTCPDGSSVMLSSLTDKVLYIDFWATWCGPCIKETPHMADLVKSFEGRDDVSLISISIDEENGPWLRMISKDKPEWPQYWIAPSDGKEFFDAMDLRAIPRFIILKKDGEISDPDAPRPSDSAVASAIEKAFSK